MNNENSGNGILSEQDAVEMLFTARESDTPEEADQATQDVEVEDEAVDLEAEAEDETVEAEGEATDDEETEATTEDGDTDEGIDADELERGYMRQADYTRKTQELAQERAQFAQERQAMEAQAQQALSQAKALMERYTVPTEQEPDWLKLSQELEPKQFQHEQAKWRDKQLKAQQAQQLHAQMVQQQHEQTREAETALLLEKLPEWQDPSIQKRDVQAMVEVGAEFGLTPEDIGNITDHRMLLGLHRLARAKTVATVAETKRVKTKPRVKAGSAPVRENKAERLQREAAARLRKTGSDDDAVALILSGG